MTKWDQIEADIVRTLQAICSEEGIPVLVRTWSHLEEPPTEEDPDDARILEEFFGFPVLVDEEEE